MERYEYSRFKYAEEFAHDIDGHWPDLSWKMYRADDTSVTENYGDGSSATYTNPCYVVEVYTEGQ